MLIGVPIAAFFLAVGLVLAFSGSDTADTSDPVATVPVSISQSQLAPSPTEAPAQPTTVPPTPLPDRTSCDAIRGTDYRSEAERTWFQQNCSAPTTASASTTTGTTATTNPAPAPAGPVAATPGQYDMGERLVIPKAGVNAPVHYGPVVAGQMIDPVGYFNVVWYDFGGYSGLGGHPTTGGNAVFAGHVDSALWRGFGGRAVFDSLSAVVVGDAIEYYAADGSQHRYVVTSVASYPPVGDWSWAVMSNAADLTIITCTGTFVGGGYDQRKVVMARKV
jgi:hypothetical protein